MAYSPEEKIEIIDRICKGISEDGESLRSVLLRDSMPDQNTFYRWINEDESKREQYARACEDRADLIFEEILSIADESHSDKKVLEDGREVTDGEVIQRSRLRVDARKWMLGKMQPKKYGDKIDVTSDGEKLETPHVSISYNGGGVDLSS